MYTILLTDEKELLATHKEAIMQCSNLCDKLQFLIPLEIADNDMTAFDTVLLEYLSPISHVYRTEFLTKSDEMYKGYIQYILPVDTKITAEKGDVELQLTFLRVEMGDNGEVQSPVFKTQPCKIKIIPIANWSQFLAEESLTQIDQRIVQMLALQEEIAQTQEQLMERYNSSTETTEESTENTESTGNTENTETT